MKNILYILFISLLFGCSSSNNRVEKMKTVDTISSNSTITYDTSILDSKKIHYNFQQRRLSHISLDSSNKINHTEIIILPPTTLLTRERRILKLVPDMEKTSNNLTGRLNYVMSDTMEVNVTTDVSVSISRNMTKEMVVNKVTTFRRNNNVSSEIVDTLIRITPEMIIKLKEVGTVGNFHIDTITPTRQLIELNDTNLTLWQWRVTPLKDGNKTLTITVDLVIDKSEKNINIYDGKIYVHMRNKFWVIIGNFFVNNWQWLWTAAFLPLLIWIFKTYILPKFKKNKLINNGKENNE